MPDHGGCCIRIVEDDDLPRLKREAQADLGDVVFDEAPVGVRSSRPHDTANIESVVDTANGSPMRVMEPNLKPPRDGRCAVLPDDVLPGVQEKGGWAVLSCPAACGRDDDDIAALLLASQGTKPADETLLFREGRSAPEDVGPQRNPHRCYERVGTPSGVVASEGSV